MVAPHTNGHHGRPAASPDAATPEELHRPATGPHPLEPLLANVKELRRHASHYVQASADSFRMTVRQVAVRAVLAILAGIVGAAVLITAAVFVLSGAAGGLGEAFGNRAWAGQLTVGLTTLLMIALGCWLGVRKITASSRQKTVQKYEQRHYEEQAHVDSDAAARIRSGQSV
jgi:energy-converting hydrogenase Eha subunit H